MASTGVDTNIIYITSGCNIGCDYCYQKDDRAKNEILKVSKEDIDAFLYNLEKNEPGVVSSVVVFGGEAFLEPDSVFYLYSKAEEITEKTGKKYNFCTTTNGIWLTKKSNRDKLFSTIKSMKNNVSIEVSYDGEGHTRRNYKNGKSTKEDVKGLLKEFKALNFPFHLRYTLHKDTIPTFKKDMLSLSAFLAYHPENRLVVSTFDTEIEKEFGYTVAEFRKETSDFLNGIYSKYQIPICDFVCEACRKCVFKLDKTNNYMVPSNSGHADIQIKEAGDFDHFTRSKGK